MEKDDICKPCKGEGITEVNETEDIMIDVGTPDEHLIKYTGKGNAIPDAVAGDLIIKVNIQPHKVFRREGADLYMEQTITLKQALLGKVLL